MEVQFGEWIRISWLALVNHHLNSFNLMSHSKFPRITHISNESQWFSNGWFPVFLHALIPIETAGTTRLVAESPSEWKLVFESLIYFLPSVTETMGTNCLETVSTKMKWPTNDTLKSKCFSFLHLNVSESRWIHAERSGFFFYSTFIHWNPQKQIVKCFR